MNPRKIIQYLTEAIAEIEQLPDFDRSTGLKMSYRQLRDARYGIAQDYALPEVIYLDEAKNRPELTEGDAVIALEDIKRSHTSLPGLFVGDFTYAEKGAIGTVIGMDANLADVRFGNQAVWGIPVRLLALYNEE